MVISFTNINTSASSLNFPTSCRNSEPAKPLVISKLPYNFEASRITANNYSSQKMIEKIECHDIWGFDLPLTPPSSPCKMMDLNSESSDFCFRIQPICPAPDDNMDEVLNSNYRKTDSIVIKDCMWGALEVSGRVCEYPSLTRITLGETPCGKQLSVENTDVSNRLLGVDPTEVFPSVSCLDDRMILKDFSSSDSDEDSDIDVVTVEPKLSQNIEDMFPKSPEIISPPKTPDSLPDSSSAYLQAMSVDDASTLLEMNSSDAAAKAMLQERFSRASHNVLERKRRNELKSKFYNLRDSVPELHGNKKVPKVVILKKAISYIETIQKEELTLKAEMQRQKKLHQELKKRLLTVLRTKSSS